MGKTDVALVGVAITKFNSYVPNLDAWQRQMSLLISYSDDKSLNSVIFVLRYQPGVEDTDIRSFAQASRPKLDSADAWSVDDKFLLYRVVSSCCLQLSYV